MFNYLLSRGYILLSGQRNNKKRKQTGFVTWIDCIKYNLVATPEDYAPMLPSCCSSSCCPTLTVRISAWVGSWHHWSRRNCSAADSYDIGGCWQIRSSTRVLPWYGRTHGLDSLRDAYVKSRPQLRTMLRELWTYKGESITLRREKTIRSKHTKNAAISAQCARFLCRNDHVSPNRKECFLGLCEYAQSIVGNARIQQDVGTGNFQSSERRREVA